jgi:hypothetical protein
MCTGGQHSETRVSKGKTTKKKTYWTQTEDAVDVATWQECKAAKWGTLGKEFQQEKNNNANRKKKTYLAECWQAT